MKVYTKKGDSGKTSLIGGTRVPKSSLRIESYGTVDELNSYLGLIRDTSTDKNVFDQIVIIQDRLFTMGSHLASDPEKSKMKIPGMDEADIEDLEKWIDAMDETLEPMRSFVLPGGHPLVSHTHIARCVCRRAERIVVDLDASSTVNPILTAYLNRLSDYLFVLSRKFSHDLKIEETPWVPKMDK